MKKPNDKFTKGPWHAVGGWVETQEDYQPDICSCDLRSMGQENLWRPLDETHANAMLIAAAPYMLSVIRFTLDAIENGMLIDDIDREVVPLLKGAIYNATGVKP